MNTHMQETEILLCMNHIEKSFPGVKVLKGINLEVRKGEVVSILGENGAGKTTLMKILSGAYSRDQYTGTIGIDGEETSYNTPKEAEKAGVVMIYQENNPFLDISVAENIFMGCFPTKKNGLIDWKKTFALTTELLLAVDLHIDPNTKMRYLNGSEHQLVAIVKAISKKSKILILDEPTSTLTKTEVERLFSSINMLKKTGVSCIYISHKIDEVFEISDRIVVLRDGDLVGTFNRDTFDYTTIISTMIGRDMQHQYPDTTHAIGDVFIKLEDFTVPHPYNRNENIVENINFSVRKGEIIGLVGLVGAGRSELVNAIYGSGPKRSGKVSIEGKPVEIQSPKDALANGIALVTEDRKKDGLVLIHDIRTNVTLSCLDSITKHYVINKKLEHESVDSIMRMLQVKATSPEVKTLHLSGGNQQKVVLGKCLLADPRIFILDEPTRGIDVGTKFEIYGKIIELARRGLSIILISSEFDELLGLCDRLLVLRKKNIVREFKKGEVDQNRLILALSGMDV